jgi:Flp pilus assembly protein TadB
VSAVKALGTAGGAGSVVAAFAGAGWSMVAAVVTLVVAVLLFAAWVVNNGSRTGRLTRLIRAFREGKPPGSA